MRELRGEPWSPEVFNQYIPQPSSPTLPAIPVPSQPPDAKGLPGHSGSPAKGTVLILPEYRTWEGDIVRKGDRYIVRKKGGQISIPKEDVIRLCTDWDDVYAFMKSQANLSDPAERKRLAKFFLVNNQPEISTIEIDKALEMRPEDVEAKRLRKIIVKEINNPIHN